jgi:hypothetical protein
MDAMKMEEDKDMSPYLAMINAMEVNNNVDNDKVVVVVVEEESQNEDA